MRGHKKSQHEKNVLICEECGSEFRLKQYYDKHLTLHTGEKKIPCRFEGCGKKFRQYTSRKNCEAKHKGEKKYKCDLCPKLFMRVNNLKIHKKRHLGKKDHSCKTCGRAFVEPAGARKCKHSVHSEQKSVTTNS